MQLKPLLASICMSICLLLLTPIASSADVTKVKKGTRVILIEPMPDGVTYFVMTPSGVEIWKDRDLFHFAGVQESCTVIESYGSEVLLYVPIMDAKYWFTVIKTNLK